MAPVKEKPVIVTAEADVLLMVAICPGLILDTLIEPKLSDAGETVSGLAPLPPVPVRETVCGEPVALSVMVMAAVIAPAVAGAKWP